LRKASTRLIFFAAPIKISAARFQELLKHIPAGYRPVFGFFRHAQIYQLGGPTFEAQTHWRRFPFPPRSIVIRYAEKDGPALFTDLKADKIVFVRGSWSTALYFQQKWHNAFRANPRLKVADITMVSPFTATEISAQPGQRLRPARRQERVATPFDKKMQARVEAIAARSLCWVRQRGAVVVKDKKIVAAAYNRVWPYEAYCLHEGCVREQELIPSGEQLDKCFTSHAEMSAIAIAAQRGLGLRGGAMYTTTFPCINCAKAMANSGLREVIFWEDYANQRGELILAGAGVKMTKLMMTGSTQKFREKKLKL
jgi:dCMP deaminase